MRSSLSTYLILTVSLLVSALKGRAAPAPSPTPSVMTVFEIGGDVGEPVEIKHVAPRFPTDARAACGLLMAEAVVDVRGNLTEVRLLRRQRNCAAFERAFLQALRQWKYKPATYKGNPVPVKITVTSTIDCR